MEELFKTITLNLENPFENIQRNTKHKVIKQEFISLNINKNELIWTAIKLFLFLKDILTSYR